MSEELTLDIESVAAGGDGVARHDGLVVFVPRTAPGDRVVAAVHRGRRFARGRVARIEVAGPGRVEPACGHYDGDQCGGCQLQHLALEAQHGAKRAIIKDTMRRIGHREIEAPPLRAGASPWRYRHRLSLALRRRADGSWLGGMHSWQDPAQVFPLADCRITDERVLALWREALAASAGFPNATELRGTVRLVEGRGALSLEGAREWTTADALLREMPGFDSIWWTPEGGRRRGVAARDARTGPHASFSQVNPEVGALLGAFVEARVLARTPAHVIDAYAGTGDLSVALQGAGIPSTAIELDEEAAAHAAARLHKPSRAVAARVEDVLAGLLPADVVVLNPPRSGVDARVTAALEASTATRGVVYVSCDPATLARDLARLPSWRIADVTAFDMFPQTAHVETVVELERGTAP